MPSHETLQDLALGTANHHHIRYVLAQDPDSDRFAAAEKSYVENGQGYSVLSDMLTLVMMELGKSLRETNSVQCSPHGSCGRGKLPGSHLVSTRTGTPADVDDLGTEKLAMVASTVSSKMVQQMARQEGFTFVECLTGACLRSQPSVES